MPRGLSFDIVSDSEQKTTLVAREPKVPHHLRRYLETRYDNVRERRMCRLLLDIARNMDVPPLPRPATPSFRWNCDRRGGVGQDNPRSMGLTISGWRMNDIGRPTIYVAVEYDNDMNGSDELWMRRAVELAERGRGAVEPNPLVGAVLVKDGAIVGEGWHERFGGDHAEVNALRQAGDLARGATLYATLEPCCHQGKTPPCIDAILRAGVARVVAAIEDPFPRVAGRGAAALKKAGVPCDFGLAGDLARLQNAPYLTLVLQNRPYVHGKWAMSLDGKIAARTGDSKWITNETSRRIVHELRGRMDGIVVGIGTVLADDPTLTARPPGPRTPSRVILDGKARLPLESRIAATAGEIPTLVAVGEKADGDAVARIRGRGCETITLPRGPNGRLDVEALLEEFGRRRWTNLLIEGGGAVLGSFADADRLDEIHCFIAPKLIGGWAAPTPVGSIGIARVADANPWSPIESRPLDGDVYLRCRRIR